jgi:secondary thiamine-phosphate synthase enzyme
MKTEILDIETGDKGPAAVDITNRAVHFVEGVESGVLLVFVPHTTAGLVLMESGSGSEEDLLELLDNLIPRDKKYRHENIHGPKGHGADHLLPTLLSPSLCVPVKDGKLVLGEWQAIMLVDLNIDHSMRRVHFYFISG